jgi:hypothetical protein
MSDQVAELADRARAMPEWQFRFQYACLTRAERREFMATDGPAHRPTARNGWRRSRRTIASCACSSPMRGGAITALEFVERVRGAVPGR